ncbi:MAG TPA: DUF6526 family protein [Vicinamibacterales bacterium]|nr:DUF6526 family protein [Vicinamibacterales bacterium]
MADVQRYENHARLVPGYHYVVLPVFAINLVWSIIVAIRQPAAGTIIAALVAVGLVLLALYARMFALTAQDRVIRLEMRLRLRERLPADLLPRLPDFTVDQLVALRFASDAELPDLARTVLRDRITDRKAIKKMIRDWQPDQLRV